MKLYITRHGETMRNAEQKVLGRTDDPLSEKGKAQAAELAEKMKSSYSMHFRIVVWKNLNYD